MAEALAVRSGAIRAWQALAGRRDVILAYHNVVPDEGTVWGDASLHLPRARFAEQLDVLLSWFDPVPLEALCHDGTRAPGRPRAAVTFDDGYLGTVTNAVPELVCRGVQATIFVVPAFTSGRTFWWDCLAAATGGVVPEAVRWTALERLRGEHDRIVEWLREAGLRLVEELHPCMRAATEEELKTACSRSGITLASHSWSHANLASLTSAEVAVDLEKSWAWLRDRFGSAAIPWLAYPYGRSGESVERAAMAAGYRGALRISGGTLPQPHGNAWAMPRLNIPAGVSREGFVLKLAGLPGH